MNWRGAGSQTVHGSPSKGQETSNSKLTKARTGEALGVTVTTAQLAQHNTATTSF
uniref:Uncharacterized protein n=1 Tax=Anguilla anguilla TaxID=7936 RepID=A0A0E9UQA9_ANGAN